MVRSVRGSGRRLVLASAALAALVAGELGCRAVLDLEEGILVTDGANDGAIDGAIDTGATDTDATDTSSGTDTGPPDPRILTFFAAAPDQPATWLCFVRFENAGDEKGKAPIAQYGPWDRSGAGFAYGDVARLQADAALDALLGAAHTFVFALDTKPSSCSAAWATANKARSKPLAVPTGASFAIASTGCAGGGQDGNCGATGNNLALSVHPLDGTSPAAGKLAFQVLNLSHFAGTGGGGGPPSFQNADVYLQPMNGSSAVGTSIQIAGNPSASSFGVLSPRVQIDPPAGTSDPLVVVMKHLDSPCIVVPGSPGCPGVPLPLEQAATPDPSRKLGPASYVVAFSGGPQAPGVGTLKSFLARVRP